MEALLSDWRKKTEKLQELVEWIEQAKKELRGVPKADPRWATFNDINAAKERLEEQIEEIEQGQVEALSAALASSGPQTVVLEDGSKRIFSANRNTAGGTEVLLPDDILRVWRVAEVFQGSILVGDECGRLQFGWKDKLKALADKPKERKPKKNAVVGEAPSLFGRE